ncbi:UDP-glucose 4-epimerase GalE [Balneolaceae bacterium ANBcel3]|nr:UDP-glucose 4-epimerase GalE [Balneolaceae bacterium ANBcel3]
MNVLVIGGAGYIGSHVVYELADAGHKVTILDNFSTGLHENVDPRACLVEGDMQDHALVRSLLKKGDSCDKHQPFDAVFHFAALKAAGESMTHPEVFTEANLIATMHLLNLMSENDIRRFVFSSSAAVYGNPEYLPIDEAHPQKPINYYGYTKLAIEHTLEWYSKLKGLRFAALRYFNAAGYDVKGRVRGKEQNPANLLPIVMEVAAGNRDMMQVFGDDYPTRDGTCIRDYIHVSDLASAHLKAMDYLVNEDKDLVINLATGEGYTVLEVIREAEKVSGLSITRETTERRPGDPADLVATSTLALDTIGWKAQYSDIHTLVSSMWEVYK